MAGGRKHDWAWAAFALPTMLCAAKPAKPPRDAPYCAAPGARPVFVSVMGEPFRAQPGQPYPVAAWFAGADANHDGAVDRAEFVADARRFFRTLDMNHDGRLVPEEVTAYEHGVAPEIALYSSRREPGLGEGRGRRGNPLGDLTSELGLGGSGTADDYAGPLGAGRFAWLNIPEPVAAADMDLDRVVTEAEFVAAASRRFDALDSAGAGALRLAALPRTPAQIAIEGPCRPRPKPRAPRRGEGQEEPQDERR